MRSKKKESFEELLLSSMREAVEIVEGREQPSRVHSSVLTARKAEATKPGVFDAVRIGALRKRLGISPRA